MISNIKWHTNKLVLHIWPLPLTSGYNQGLDHNTCLMFGLALSQHTVTMYIYRTLTLFLVILRFQWYLSICFFSINVGAMFYFGSKRMIVHCCIPVSLLIGG